tara:strand:+ start:1955 stop:2113 length:159 start_codon:yes stop_codon:yes gene_type:complete
MIKLGKLEVVLSFIVIMFVIGCVFFVEMPTTNADLITNVSISLFENLPKDSQ